MTSDRCECHGLSLPARGLEDRWCYRAVKKPIEVRAVLDDLVERLREFGYPQRDRFAIRLAVEEAMVNAIQHGNRSDVRKTVLVRFCVEATFCIAQVEDEGPGFEPAIVVEPRKAQEPASAGHGLILMRHYMDSVEFNPAGNCVTLCKHRSLDSGMHPR